MLPRACGVAPRTAGAQHQHHIRDATGVRNYATFYYPTNPSPAALQQTGKDGKTDDTRGAYEKFVASGQDRDHLPQWLGKAGYHTVCTECGGAVGGDAGGFSDRPPTITLITALTCIHRYRNISVRIISNTTVAHADAQCAVTPSQYANGTWPC